MLLQRFQEHIKDKFHLHQSTCKLLLAVSGGLDSIVMTDLFYNSGFDFIIAHCNFQLREQESDRDEAFVRSLQSKYEKEVLVKKFDTTEYANKYKLSIQEAARDLRYKWFEEIINREWLMVNGEWLMSSQQPVIENKTQSANLKSKIPNLSAGRQDPKSQVPNPKSQIYIATAHHANDNIETMLINFFRGTGIHGLTGIPALDKERRVIRPLLFAKREEIIDYAQKNNLQWVEDSSNTSDKYTRNFFRLKLIPAIKEIFPQVEDNLLHNIERLTDADVVYSQAITNQVKKLAEQKGNEWHIPLLKLQKAGPINAMIWEIIKRYDFSATQVQEVEKLFASENGSYISSVSHRVIKNRSWLIIAPLKNEEAQNILIEEGEKRIIFENGELEINTISHLKSQIPNSNLIASVDSKEVKFPLLLRKWKQGDYFYPLGMQKKKKLSRFFIDRKLSRTEKENVWVIETNKKIIWVIGHRIDDRFKITPSTQKLLRLTFHQK